MKDNNTGDYNSGNCNSGYYNSGWFNTNEPKHAVIYRQLKEDKE